MHSVYLGDTMILAAGVIDTAKDTAKKGAAYTARNNVVVSCVLNGDKFLSWAGHRHSTLH
ncbi:MAG: hypothetical protein V3T17_03235 [Pseudomonadales bacterium]